MTQYRFALITGVLVFTLSLCLASVGAQGQARAKKPAPAGPLPPIPFQGYPAPRPPQVVQSVFEFAARHPEVLQYVPCFCGCEAHGHVGNDDCFVRSRDAAGRVTWEPHGYGWAICIDVARDAMQMYHSGAPIASIRSAIEAKYRPRYPTQTPTPPAPKK